MNTNTERQVSFSGWYKLRTNDLGKQLRHTVFAIMRKETTNNQFFRNFAIQYSNHGSYRHIILEQCIDNSYTPNCKWDYVINNGWAASTMDSYLGVNWIFMMGGISNILHTMYLGWYNRGYWGNAGYGYNAVF